MLAVKNYKFWFCTGSQDLYAISHHSRWLASEKAMRRTKTAKVTRFSEEA